MTQVIIYQQTDTETPAVVHPSGQVPIEQLVGMAVPAGSISEIIEESSLPDSTFRNAWRWAGVGQDVVINMDDAKQSAINTIKPVAIKAAVDAEKQELIGESPTYSPTQIRQAYLTCKQEIENATTLEQLKQCMNNFVNTYEVDS